MKQSSTPGNERIAAVIQEQDFPALARGVRLRRDPVSGEALLLFPEGILPLDSPADDIVRLCDGGRTVEAIIHSLAEEYEVDAGTLRTDVVECLSELCRRQLLVVDSSRPTTLQTEVPNDRVRPAFSKGKFCFRPYLLLAELTYRCPLHCPYCSNPSAYPRGEELATSDWCRVLREAAEMGVLHVGFSGGEPLQRDDLPELVRAAHEAGLYSNLITSAVGLNSRRAGELKSAGLDSVQISLQSDEEAPANHIAGTSSHALKLAAARMVRDLGFPLTLNVVLHRGNIGRIEQIIALAERLGAERVELANTQYYGWAFRNRGALLPTREQVMEAAGVAVAARKRLSGRMEILWVMPDYYSDRPKPCMDGWGRRYLTVNPAGEVLPCPTAGEIKELRFDNVRNRSLSWIWEESEAFNRFRGLEWMPAPCRDCEFREVDFGGCRCQAALLTGRADVTDPACSLSPQRDLMTRLIGGVHEDAGPMAPFPFLRQNPL